MHGSGHGAGSGAARRRAARGAVTLALAAAAATAACEGATGPDALDPAIWTDRPAYTVEADDQGWSAEIPYTFTNRAPWPVEIAHCNGAISLRLDRWSDDGGWDPVWYPVLPLCLSVPIAIEPGEAFPDTLRFFAARPGSGASPDIDVDDIDGSYRIVWLDVVFAGRDADDPGAPLRYRASNPFTLRD